MECIHSGNFSLAWSHRVFKEWNTVAKEVEDTVQLVVGLGLRSSAGEDLDQDALGGLR